MDGIASAKSKEQNVEFSTKVPENGSMENHISWITSRWLIGSLQRPLLNHQF